MSSGSSGRYQSRFFNFVNQQSRRLTEHWESTFRNLQVKTKWGVEALLYPVYLFLQSADSSVKKLHSKEASSRQRLQPHNTDLFSEIPLATDRPIQRVLESVEYLQSEDTTLTVSKKSRLFQFWEFLPGKFFNHRSTKPISDQGLAKVNPSLPQDTLKRHLSIVRGIASDLANHQLVLVSHENQILDILTPQQQAKLTDRVISEVADYWHSWQLIEAKQQARLLPEINQILTKLTGDDREKMPVININEKIVTKFLKTNNFLAFLDVAIAQLEQTAIVPAQQRSLEMMRVAQTQLNIFLYGKEQLNSRRQIVSNFPGLETNKQNISNLLEAALNYFFGVPKNNLIESGFYDQQLLDSSHQSPHECFTNDPWLDWHDLYDDSEKITERIRESSRIKPSFIRGKSANLIGQKSKTTPQQKPTSSLTQKSTKTSNKVTAKKQPETHISPGRIYPENQVEDQPDWIETTATVLGYEKHLLEYILEWLDRGILWLEQLLTNIFYFLQGLLQGK